jgi:hypothetical protein
MRKNQRYGEPETLNMAFNALVIGFDCPREGRNHYSGQARRQAGAM